MESNCNDKNKIDIEKIMTQIKENVRRKKEAGIYSDEDIRRISDLSLEIKSFGNSLSDQIAFLQRNYDFRVDYNISSPRPFWGKFIVLAKKLFTKIVLKLASPMWDKSVSYNFHVVQIINSLAEEIETLKKECEILKQQHKTEIKSKNTIDRDKV